MPSPRGRNQCRVTPIHPTSGSETFKAKLIRLKIATITDAASPEALARK